MPLQESYVIWNNKGGVGKTTLTFHMATRYASRNPGVNVLVIDLCPQANVSMALLSSPDNQLQGSNNVSSLYRQNKTISCYLQRSTENMGKKLNAERFLTCVSHLNSQVPSNLFLLCGDMSLELVGRHLEHLRSGVAVPRHNPWVTVTTSIRSFIEGSKKKIIGVSQSQFTAWVVFIDTNPSFSVYTEIALAAANKLIIPINADDFSIQAVRAMLDLVYGIRPEKEEEEEESENFTAYREYMFSYKARKFNLRLPQIHLLINNRTTTIFTVFTRSEAQGEENLKVLFEAYQKHQEEKMCFSPREEDICDIEDFKEEYFEDIRDFHTTAILSIHTGCPLDNLSGSVSVSEEVKVKVNKSVVTDYLKCLDSLVRRL